MPRFLALVVLVLAAGCVGPSRVLTVGQNPDTGALEIHAENTWFGGPVEGDVEFRAPDGTYFKGHFGATADLDPALQARLAQEASLRDLLARIEAIARMAAAAYGVPAASSPTATPASLPSR